MDPQSLDDLQTKFVTICMDGEGISMFFSLDDDGVAIVTSLRLSLRFQLNINSLHIDKESHLYDWSAPYNGEVKH
jgi:hypothetical protein